MTFLRRVLLALVPAIVLAITLSASAQSYPIDKVVFKGGAPYTDAELLATAGLKPGDVLTTGTLANPAQNLLNTGLFDDAGMDLAGPGNRTAIIELKATPLNTLMPASFQNFIWWSPQQLAEEIHKRVPLFHGVCSDAGNFPDLIQAALEQMLGEKGIQATTSHTIIEPTTDNPHRVVNFVIEKPIVYVSSISLTGVPASLAAATQTMSARLTKTSFNEGLSGFTTEDALLYPALTSGYITANLTGVQRTITPASNGIAIAYSAQLVPGEPYKVSSIAWQPTPVYSAASFASDNALHPGDLASIKLLRQTEAKIITAYRAQGYIDAYIEPSPTRDDAAHTVAYALQAVPGEVYRIKSVTALNLSPEAQQEFNSAWLMKTNDVYNESYVKNFIQNNSALRVLSGYTASYHAVGDPQTHLVDLTLTFFPGPPTH